MRPLPPRVRRLFRLPWRSADRIRDDVDREIAFHLEMRTEELMREGVDRDRARARAEREFGDVGAARRKIADADDRIEKRERWRAWWDDLRGDLAFSARTLRKQAGFTLVAIGILALGIGASVGMFTVLNAVVLRPLPYPDADRLIRVSPGQNFNITLADAVEAGVPSIASATGLSVWGLTLTGAGEPVAIPAQVVDPRFFDVFGVRPALGRPFLDGERDPDRSGVVILSHSLWQGRFGGDPEIIGRRLDLDGYDHETREVVGVMPEGFRAPLTAETGPQVELWVPYNLPPGKTVPADSSWYVNTLVARLAPGATVEGAAREVRATMVGLRERFGGLIGEDAVRTAGAAGLLDSIVGDVRGTLWQLLSAVALVLLLACANLANLLLARAEGERRELAVRAALGAGRARLVRQQLTRSGILAIAGGVAGLVLARGTLAVLRVGDVSGLPRTGDISLDWRVMAFALGAASLSAAAFGLAPALRATAGDVRDDLTAGGRRAGRSRRSRRLVRGLVVGEMALAVVLVAAAGLMLNSFRVLRSVDPGMDPDDVLAVWLQPPPNEYQSRERTLALYDEVVERLSALPGVRRAGAIHLLPFTDNNWAFPYLAEGHSPPVDAPLPSVNFRVVLPGYFETVDVPLLAGRDVAPTDGPDAGRVGLINRAFARELWPGEDPIGREIRIFGNVPVRVVGVVGDVRQHALDRAPVAEMYVPLAQWRVTSMVVMLEGTDVASLAPAAREAVWAIDDDVPISAVRPLTDAMAESVARHRFFTGVIAFFGLLALALGAFGVYGVMSYTVRARLPEFGIRMALGATPGAVRRAALLHGLVPVAAGLAIGLAGALATGRLLSGLLYGVEATDPGTFLVVLTVLAGVATMATLVPAHRASRVDPARVLEVE